MKHNLRTACAATVLLMTCLGARATASVSIDLGNAGFNSSFGSAQSGAAAEYGSILLSLTPQQPLTLTLPYTVTLSSDGLASPRDWDFCTPSWFSYCGRPPTGSESAEAYLTWDLFSNGVADGVNIAASDPVDFYLSKGSATYTGTLTFTATDADLSSLQIFAVPVIAYFVDSNPSSPIPEPPVATLVLAAAALGGAASVFKRRTGRH